MDIRKLQRVIVDGLEDVKAQNIVVFKHRASVTALRTRHRRVGNEQPADKVAGSERSRRGEIGRRAGTAHRGRRQRRMDHRRLRRRRRPRHAARDPRVLPPRRALGRQARADEDRRCAAGAPGQGRSAAGRGTAHVAAPWPRRCTRRGTPHCAAPCERKRTVRGQGAGAPQGSAGATRGAHGGRQVGGEEIGGIVTRDDDAPAGRQEDEREALSAAPRASRRASARPGRTR